MTGDFEDAVARVIAAFDPDHAELVRSDIDSLRSRGVASWPDLVAVLNDRSAGDDRHRACWLLGRIKDERALGPLADALHDSDPRVRGEAARSLGALDSSQAVPWLITVLQTDGDADTRKAAAFALGLLGDPRAIDPLLAKLAETTEEPRVRGSVAEAFSWYKDRRAVPHLIAVLSDSSVEVRFWAAFALGELKDPAALTGLEQLAQSDNATLPGWGSVKNEAAAAIQRIRANNTSAS